MFTFTRQVCITYDGWNMKERKRGYDKNEALRMCKWRALLKLDK